MFTLEIKVPKIAPPNNEAKTAREITPLIIRESPKGLGTFSEIYSEAAGYKKPIANPLNIKGPKKSDESISG
ncbi:hypothetical protein D3C71_2034080 [compost metagenome]